MDLDLDFSAVLLQVNILLARWNGRGFSTIQNTTHWKWHMSASNKVSFSLVLSSRVLLEFMSMYRHLFVIIDLDLGCFGGESPT